MSLRCDTVIRDALIIDGSGAPGFRGDVGISGDRIVAVGDLGNAAGDREVMANGHVLAPGFIDAHTHDDRAVLSGPECLFCKTSQGVTTVVTGNCGISLSPLRARKRPVPPLDLLGDESWWTFDSFGDYADALRRSPAQVNTYAMVGHMTLRVEAMGDDTDRQANDREIARMHDRLAASLREGASGFSTGLWYRPNSAATAAEVIAVGGALRESGGLYASHMRDEGDNVLDSIRETLDTGRGIGAPVVISHHKCIMPENHGRTRETLPMIARAAETQSVDFDVYPYAAGSTVLLPERLRPDIRVQVTWSVPHPEMAGRDIDDVAREWGVSPKEAAGRLLPAGAIYFQMHEDDVRAIMAHPRSMIGSDGLPHDARPHPRLWGTFPRVLGHYARDEKLFPLEVAVHKMTGRCAEVFGITDRGAVRAGAFADLVLFDPATVADAATFAEPTLPAVGIGEVWCNGVPTFRGGRGSAGEGSTGERPGRLVTRGR